MRSLKFIAPVAVALAAVGCTDLEVTNPNQRTTDTFWRNQADAATGLNSVYAGLQFNGVHGRWLWFISDARADVGTSRSPWTDLANWTRTVLVTPNFGPNTEVWDGHYQALFRANQAIEAIPNIADMNEGLQSRMTAEAKFVRGVLHYNLALLFGGVPVMTKVMQPGEFPASGTVEDVWQQAASDFTEAAAVLPVSYTGGDIGRATRGAALSMLAKVQMQRRQWPQAATTWGQVRALGVYSLAPTYAENFTYAGNNNMETVFDVQFGGPSFLALGTRGLNVAKLVGPPGFSFTDVQPTEWFFQQFFKEGSYPNNPDPRLDATIFWNKPGGMMVHLQPFAQLYANGFMGQPVDKTYFWKKYEEYWLPVQDWDAGLNAKIVRFAEVLLGQSEALNEAGQVAEALDGINRVRARAGMPAIPGGISQAVLRARIEHEWLMEFGWENKRLEYLKRHNKFNRAYLLPNDPDFVFFQDGKSELLPIPTTETDLNPNVRQNPGW